MNKLLMKGTLTIRVLSRLHVGGFSPVSAASDDGTAMRDGQPIIPGSALKGAIRETYTRLVAGRQKDANQNSTLCIPYCPPPVQEGKHQPECPVCKLFGTQGDQSFVLSFSDAVMHSNTGFRVVAQHRVGIRRKTRTQMQDHLFAIDNAFFDKGSVLVADVMGRLTETEKEELTAAVAATLAIGGNRSTGCGRVSMILDLKPVETFRPTDDDRRVSVWMIAEMLSPICIGTEIRDGGNVTETLSYIPGSAIRGAIATRLIESGAIKPEDELFRTMFLEGDDRTIFEPLYPSPRFEEGGISDVIPMPLTALKCKSGHSSDGKLHDKLHDSLMPGLLAEWLNKELTIRTSATLQCSDSNPAHPCRLERASGYLYRESNSKYRSFAPGKSIYTRVALDRRTGGAVDGNLFTIQSLSVSATNPVRFVGRIIDIPKRVVESLKTMETVQVGKATGGGYGRIRISFEELSSESDLKIRLSAFSDAIANRWKTVSNAVPPELIAVTIATPIPLEPSELATDVISRSFKGVIEKKIERQLVIGRYSLMPEKSGPQEPRTAIAPGSVYLIRASSGGFVPNELTRIERLGVCNDPEDRCRGLGRIVICHPFHVKNCPQVR